MKKLHFIINGEDVFVPSFDADTLGDARLDALALSRNTGRPVEDWELRQDNGARVDLSEKASCWFGKRMYLTIAIGVGGALPQRPPGKMHCYNEDEGCDQSCYSTGRCDCFCDRCDPWNDYLDALEERGYYYDYENDGPLPVTP